MSVHDDLDPSIVGLEFIKEGSDWLAIFNPKVPRQMDVSLTKRFTHEKVICSVRLSADAKLLAVGSDGLVLLYDLATDTKLTFPFEDVESTTRNYVRAVALSPNGKYLISGSEDKLIRVWNIEHALQVHTLHGHRGEIYALEFSTDGSTLLSASGDRTVRLWDVTCLDANNTDVIMSSSRVLTVEEAAKSDVAFTSVSISQNSRYVAAGSLDGVIRVWDLTAIPEDSTELEGAKLVDRLSGHKRSVYSVKFVHGLSTTREKGEALVSGSLDKTVKRWDVGPFDGHDDVREASPGLEGHGENGSKCVKTFQGHKDYVLATAIVREGQYFRAASASRDGSVRMWDLRTGMALFLIQGHKNTVTSVDLSQDGSQLVSGSGDREVRIWTYTIR